MTCFYLCFALLLLASVAVAGEWEYPPPVLPPLPTYNCVQVPEPPVLDGDLDDPCWQGIEPLHLRRCVSGNPPTQATTVRLVWHGDYLYAAWRVCEWNIQDHNRHRNDPVYSEACVEHFLQAPGGFPPYLDGPHRYCEVDISPTGVIWDGRIENPYDFLHYNPEHRLKFICEPEWDPPEVKCASRISGTLNDDSDRDSGWTLEVQIPLNAPPGGKTPQIGEVWRLNLYRIHAWGEPDQELQAWSVVGIPNFHVPQRFGYLRFAGPRE